MTDAVDALSSFPVELSAGGVTVRVYLSVGADGSPPSVLVSTGASLVYPKSAFRVVVNGVVAQEGFVPEGAEVSEPVGGPRSDQDVAEAILEWLGEVVGVTAVEHLDRDDVKVLLGRLGRPDWPAVG